MFSYDSKFSQTVNQILAMYVPVLTVVMPVAYICALNRILERLFARYIAQQNESSQMSINIDLNNTYLPNGLNRDAAGECARYDALIHSLGGVDLQLLGIGHNGHIGFNEPSDCFVKGTNCVDLTQNTIDANARFFADESQVPRQAYTMGMLEILQAKRVVMIVSGAGKAHILKEAFCGPITPKVPASIMQLHPDFTLVADEAAAAEMKDLI